MLMIICQSKTTMLDPIAESFHTIVSPTYKNEEDGSKKNVDESWIHHLEASPRSEKPWEKKRKKNIHHLT